MLHWLDIQQCTQDDAIAIYYLTKIEQGLGIVSKYDYSYKNGESILEYANRANSINTVRYQEIVDKLKIIKDTKTIEYLEKALAYIRKELIEISVFTEAERIGTCSNDLNEGLISIGYYNECLNAIGDTINKCKTNIMGLIKLFESYNDGYGFVQCKETYFSILKIEEVLRAELDRANSL